MLYLFTNISKFGAFMTSTDKKSLKGWRFSYPSTIFIFSSESLTSSGRILHYYSPTHPSNGWKLCMWEKAMVQYWKKNFDASMREKQTKNINSRFKKCTFSHTCSIRLCQQAEHHHGSRSRVRIKGLIGEHWTFIVSYHLTEQTIRACRWSGERGGRVDGWKHWSAKWRMSTAADAFRSI